MASITVVRHAQASFGSREYDALSPLGLRQAAATGRHFAARGERFDRVLAGPRARHAQTAQALLDRSARVEVEAALDECGAGHALMRRVLATGAGGSRRELLERYLDALDRWGPGEDDEPGCETRAAFEQRVGGWFDRTCAALARGERVLVVTSAGVVAMLVSQTLRAPPDAWGRMLRTMRNASISELLVTGGRRSLASFNSVAHLPAGEVSGI